MRLRLSFIVLLGIITSWSSVIAKPMDEVALGLAKYSAILLITACVDVPDLDPKQIAACSATKASYIAELSILVSPAPLEITVLKDPYAWSIFTPCHYEVAYLIVPEICPSL